MTDTGAIGHSGPSGHAGAGRQSMLTSHCEAPEFQAGIQEEGSLSLIRVGITSKHGHATY